MSDHITWEICPRCGGSAAVGWIDGHPVEFDCMSRCLLMVAELRNLAVGAQHGVAISQGERRVAATGAITAGATAA